MDRLTESYRDQVKETLKDLAINPFARGVRKLKGQKGLFRVRAGELRIIFAVHQKQLVVLVVAVGKRTDIYKWLRRR